MRPALKHVSCHRATTCYSHVSPSLASSHLGGEVAENQELPQSCSQLHPPCLYTTATHQTLAKLTNIILLSPNTPTTPNLLRHFLASTPHMCGLWFAVYWWHSLSFPTPFFSLPTHSHMPFRRKGCSSNLAQETMCLFPRTGWEGSF